MQKKIRYGKVAVLFSPYHGAGWYTWHHVEALLFDPKVVEMVEVKTSAQTIELYCNEVYGNKAYYGGSDQLTVTWISVGTYFRIHEYDGAETIEIREGIDWILA